jgi:hypothetical protein
MSIMKQDDMKSCSLHRKKRNAEKVLLGNKSLGRPMHRWENNVKKDLNAPGWEGVDSTHRASGMLS